MASKTQTTTNDDYLQQVYYEAVQKSTQQKPPEHLLEDREVDAICPSELVSTHIDKDIEDLTDKEILNTYLSVKGKLENALEKYSSNYARKTADKSLRALETYSKDTREFLKALNDVNYEKNFEDIPYISDSAQADSFVKEPIYFWER